MTPPASGRGTPLSLDEVIEAALELTSRVGLRGLTMRGLANALGVSPMATYHYVANKQDLINLVAESVSSTWPRLEPSDAPWDEVLRRHLLMVWDSLRRYPGLGTHLMDQPFLGVTESLVNRSVEFFQAAGFSRTEAMLAWSLTATYLHGRFNVDTLLHGVEGLRLDDLRARDFIEFGVDTLIDGLRARLRAVQADASGMSAAAPT